jgi:UDP-glucuronate 4-epimerase
LAKGGFFMKHFLVTGGAGFIGSNLIKELFNQNPGVKITCIDNLDPFYPASIKKLNIRDFEDNPGFRFLQLDIADASVSKLQELINEPIDVIIHLAAKAGVRPSILNPIAYQQTNIIGTQRVLDFAMATDVKQFVFGSSSSVYGINDHFPWKEDEQLMPISPYAMTKLSGEMLGHVYSKLFGIRFIALRFFTVYGPGQRPDLAIHKFTKAILSVKPITMFGNGSTSRDYTYVDDIVKGIIAAASYEKSGFEIINLGNSYSISLKELIHAIEEVIGEKAIIEQQPEQSGDVPRTFADINKAGELLAYHPQTKLSEGIKNFYDWFVQNKELVMKN